MLHTQLDVLLATKRAFNTLRVDKVPASNPGVAGTSNTPSIPLCAMAQWETDGIRHY
jgi:hypothetical protein